MCRIALGSLLAGFLLVPSFVLAQSADETLNFINDKFKSCLPHQSRRVGNLVTEEDVATLIKVNEGQLIIQWKATGEVMDAAWGPTGPIIGSVSSSEVVTANFRDVETTVGIGNLKILLHCAVGQCFEMKGNVDAVNPKPGQKVDDVAKAARFSPRLTGNYSEVDFDFCDQSTAERVAKAMEHLIELSGGKKTPF
jgi:hypothetical protein